MKALRFLLPVLLLYAAPAKAVIGVIDNVPGATLLFPRFEVDVENDAGLDTMVTIQNASATAMLVNVTLWTDYGLPTASFPIYLTGYDTENIDLRTVFKRLLPETASAGQDPGGNISPKGPFSQDINFASCAGTLPAIASNGSLVSTEITAAHSGKPSTEYFAGKCGSYDYGDGIARGYLTADTVNQCGGPKNVSNAGYDEKLTQQNTLLGEWLIFDNARQRVLADNAVAVEASGSDPLTSPINSGSKYTFYARFVNYQAKDAREPLPTAWAGFDSQGRTDLTYWRDPGVSVAPFNCGSAPSPYPLTDKLVTAFTAAGNTVSVPAGNHFPLASGLTPDTTLGATSSSGWLFTNMNLTSGNGPLDSIRQSWISYRQVPRGVPAGSNLGYAAPGTQLGNAATGADPVLP